MVSGGAGPGEGHYPGNLVFVAVPPGGKCGGSDNAKPGYASREEALAASKDPKAAKSTGNLHDVDYFDNRSGPHKANGGQGDNKISGDDKGPHYDINLVGKGANQRYAGYADPADWPSAITRRAINDAKDKLNGCAMPWWP